MLLTPVLGCGGGGAAPPDPEPPAPPTFVVTDAQASPFEFVTLGTVGAQPGEPGTVRLRGASGFDVTLPLYEAEPVQFVSPPHIDPTTGLPSAAPLTVDVTVPSGTFRGNVALQIADLPQLSSPTGQASLDVLQEIYDSGLPSAVADVTALLTNVPGGDSVVPAEVIEAVDISADYLLALHFAVADIVAGTRAEVTIGDVPTDAGPRTLSLGSQALALLDRYIAALVLALDTAPVTEMSGSQKSGAGSTLASPLGLLGSRMRHLLRENPGYVDVLAGAVAVGVGAGIITLSGPLVLLSAVTARLLLIALSKSDMEYEAARITQEALTGSGLPSSVQNATQALDGDGAEEMDDGLAGIADPLDADPLHPLGPAFKRFGRSKIARWLGLGQYGNGVGSNQIQPYPWAGMAGTYSEPTSGTSVTIVIHANGHGSFSGVGTPDSGPGSLSPDGTARISGAWNNAFVQSHPEFRYATVTLCPCITPPYHWTGSR